MVRFSSLTMVDQISELPLSFDSKKGVARFSPHTAFDDPNTPVESPYRESIEVRALVFFDE